MSKHSGVKIIITEVSDGKKFKDGELVNDETVKSCYFTKQMGMQANGQRMGYMNVPASINPKVGGTFAEDKDCLSYKSVAYDRFEEDGRPKLREDGSQQQLFRMMHVGNAVARETVSRVAATVVTPVAELTEAE